MALSGLVDIGKTQVVLQYANPVLQKHSDYSVFWKPALSAEAFEQAYGDIARRLGISTSAKETEDVKELVAQYLSTEAAGRWLLTVDNADDLSIFDGGEDGLMRSLPESRLGLTIFTTRDREVTQGLVGADVVRVEKMGHSEAMAVLRTSLDRRKLVRDEATTAELLDELECLPLAITQAAAYINSVDLSLAEYVQTLRGTEKDMVFMLSEEMGDRTRYRQLKNAVATTWLISLTRLVDQHPDAAEVLRFTSCIEWKAIPHSILPPLQPAARLTRAVGVLCSYSFLANGGGFTTCTGWFTQQSEYG